MHSLNNWYPLLIKLIRWYISTIICTINFWLLCQTLKYNASCKRIFRNPGGAYHLAASPFPTIRCSFVYPGSCTQMYNHQARRISWNPLPKSFDVKNFIEQHDDNGPTWDAIFIIKAMVPSFATIAQPIQIARVRLAIAHTKVWMTFI